MVDAKEKVVNKILEAGLFIYLSIYPFGQLIRINFSLLGMDLALHPIDLVICLISGFFIFNGLKVHRVYRYVLNFISICLFSLLYSLTMFGIDKVFVGFLYLARLSVYSIFFLSVWNLCLRKPDYKKILLDCLILISTFTALFGWIQYFLFPDLRFLKYIGWDDHLNRLVGTFLDPGFTGIILVLGFLAVFGKFLEQKKVKLLPVIAYLFLSTAFTYARASYLAFIGGVFCLVILNRKKWIVLLTIGIFLLLLPFLPRQAGEGIRLERTFSIYAKLENYQETLKIIKINPLFGVGFNNICPARVRVLNDDLYKSHSCSGSDSSLLFIVATTGIVGFLIFLSMAIVILKSLKQSISARVFLACCFALFLHSFFVHSLFYPWVMGWMAILLAISLESSRLT